MLLVQTLAAILSSTECVLVLFQLSHGDLRVSPKLLQAPIIYQYSNHTFFLRTFLKS